MGISRFANKSDQAMAFSLQLAFVIAFADLIGLFTFDVSYCSGEGFRHVALDTLKRCRVLCCGVPSQQ